MNAKLTQGSLAAVLAAAAIAILMWAIKGFIESVLLVSSVVANLPERGVTTSGAWVGVYFLGLVIVIALAAGAYFLFDRLRSQINKQARKQSSDD